MIGSLDGGALDELLLQSLYARGLMVPLYYSMINDQRIQVSSQVAFRMRRKSVA